MQQFLFNIYKNINMYIVHTNFIEYYYQAQELRVYFKSLGAEISEEKSPKGIEDDLHKIIGVCEACFKEGNENEIETVLNDIVSIMILVNLAYLMLYCHTK